MESLHGIQFDVCGAFQCEKKRYKQIVVSCTSHRIGSLLAFAVLCTSAIWTTACGSVASSQGNHRTARAFLLAASTGDVDTAWGLLHPRVQINLGRTQFAKRISELNREDKNNFREWSREISQHSETHSWTKGERSIRLERDLNGRWLIVDAAQVTHPAVTPMHALSLFQKFVLAADTGGMLKMVPKAERDGLTQEMIMSRLTEPDFLDDLVIALDVLTKSNQVQQTGPNEWTIQSGRHIAVLMKEQHHWRILDIR